MKRQLLGRTGFSATVLGIGDVADRSVPLEQCAATVRRALDHGLNVVDTAPMYEDGYSEEILSVALEGRRDVLFLIDKIDKLDEPVAPQVDASLRRLRVDHADLFAFHAVSRRDHWERIAAVAMGELARCQEAGKVRFKGIYPNEQAAAFRAYDRFAPLTADQMRDIERRAAVAVAGKGPCWWNP
jgi:1-deoxyxylulose-5-phosphate synthase